MGAYIDAFALPIPTDRIEDYRRLVETVAEIWVEHGALEYCEYSGDDMDLEGTRSFAEALGANAGEAVLFGWVLFASREARDIANEKVAADPRMADLVGSSNSGFDAARMAYGGFRPFVRMSADRGS